MMRPETHEPAIRLLPSIVRKQGFPEVGVFVQSPIGKVLINRNSPSYVPSDSPFSLNNRSRGSENISNIVREKTELEDLLMGFKLKYKTLEEKVEKLLLENERLNTVVESGYGKVKELREKIDVLLRENEKLQEIVKADIRTPHTSDTERTFSRKPSAPENLSLTVREQSKEIEVWKEKYKEKSSEVRKLEGSLSLLVAKIESLSEENELLKKEAQGKRGDGQKDSDMMDLRAKLEALIQDNSRLTEAMDRLCEQHKLEKESNEREIAEFGGVRNNLEENLKIMIDENKKLTDIINRKNEELEAFEGLEEKIGLLVKENEKVNRLICEKREEVDYWKKRYFDHV